MLMLLCTLHEDIKMYNTIPKTVLVFFLVPRNNAMALNDLDLGFLDADDILRYIHGKIQTLKASADDINEIRKQEEILRLENALLKKEVEVLKARLIEAEKDNGVKQVQVPSAATQRHLPPAPKQAESFKFAGELLYVHGTACCRWCCLLMC